MERALTESQRDKFEDMLRGLTLERAQIKEAMAFALDNAEAAGEVSLSLLQAELLHTTATCYTPCSGATTDHGLCCLVLL